uniref:Uncharacterized protein n=1 Tax=Lepeophtheirus salmonis TaxID=72036 RepID=A0A0K2TEM0_LEPSM
MFCFCLSTILVDRDRSLHLAAYVMGIALVRGESAFKERRPPGDIANIHSPFVGVGPNSFRIISDFASEWSCPITRIKYM